MKFFYIINFGLGQDEIHGQFAIRESFFNLPTQKQLWHWPDLENGG
jgi:isopenicillin N synthase-like dioxygenase